MSDRINVGIIAYNPPPTFRNVLQVLERVSDTLVVVYGRFKGFHHTYVEHPEYIEDHATLILSDHKLPQHKQRDLYLEGIQPGDTLFQMDSDWIPSHEKGYRTIADMDSEAFLIKVIGTYTNSLVCAFRWKRGYSHSPGNIIRDEVGNLVCSPAYNVMPIDDDILHYEHTERKLQDEEYNKSYQDYYSNL